MGEVVIQVGASAYSLILPREIRMIPSPWVVHVAVGVFLQPEDTTNKVNLLDGSVRHSYNGTIS